MWLPSWLRTSSRGAARTPRAPTRASVRPRRARPALEQLENRLAPAAASPLSLPPSPVSFDSATGALAIAGQAADDSARVSLSGTNLEVTVDGQSYSSNPASAAFDPALQGVSAGNLALLQFDGLGQGTLLLTDFHAGHDLTVRTNAALQLAGQVDSTAALDVLGQSIEVVGSVHAPELALASTGLLLVDGGGRVDASGGTGGQITIAAGNVLNEGSISAGGRLGAGGSVRVDFSGAYLDTASALTSADGQGGPGGQVTISGGTTGHLFTSGSQQATGTSGGGIDLLGRDVVLAGGHADASGQDGGGVIHVGGGRHGNGAGLPNAQTVQVLAGTTLAASAAGRGNGGQVIVWADATNSFAGQIVARGGAAGGDGGFVEVSAGGELTYGGTVAAGAAAGHAGTLLLDPQDLVVSSAPAGVFPQFNLIDPDPTAGGGFGTNVVTLANGNVVVTNFYDSLAARQAGAVYLFDGQTGSLLGALVGSQAGDGVGDHVTALADGNYVVDSFLWANGGAAAAGAVTLVSGSTGLALNGGSGTVSASNSLVGSQAIDQVGSGGVTALADGNYVVQSDEWANGGEFQAGAVTLVSGSTGLALNGGSGTVSASNSLVGSQAGDHVGLFGVTALADGNYVVDSVEWANGGTGSAGAVTLVSGSTGLALNGGSGTISSTNSLVGSQTSDSGRVGDGGVTALADGNYVVDSYNWANGGAVEAGAVTLVSGSTGLALNGGSGTVSASNSLVGIQGGDEVGFGGVTALADGNYVVDSYNWANGGAVEAGAVTLVSGSTGLPLRYGSSTISASNSLVGSQSFDVVGFGGVTALADGNYVVDSYNWANGGTGSAGAVTLVSGSSGLAFEDLSGTISASNSLVGSQFFDEVGSGGVIALADGNYVVDSYDWANSGASNAGAVTLISGSTGLAFRDGSDAVSASNSLVGSQVADEVGNGSVTALADGNYVVDSYFWANGGAGSAGAVTLVSGTTGLALDSNRTPSANNSFVGNQTGDQVGYGGVTALADGNYVVDSDFWVNGSAGAAGAVTLVSGSSGLALIGGSHVPSASNSLVGRQAGDQVGGGGVTVLADGNYVVGSHHWANGGATIAGAVTLVNGGTGLGLDGLGVVSAQNSVVGLTASAAFHLATLNTVTGTFLAASASDGSGPLVVGLENLNQLTYAAGQGQDVTLSAEVMTQTLDAGTAVVLQASNDISVNAPITVSAGGHGGNLTLQAGGSIFLNASISTDNGNLTLIANDLLANGVVNRDRNFDLPALITMADGTTLDAGAGAITIDLRAGTGKVNTDSGAITLQTINAASLTVANNGPTFGSDILPGQVTTTGPQTYSNPNGTTNVTGNLVARNGPITFDGNTVISSAPSAGSIDFSGSDTQTLSSTVALGNVLHDGSATLQLIADLTLSGSFTNTAGTLDAIDRTLLVAGNWTWTAGTFVSTGSTVQFDGAVQALLSGGQAFNNLIHAGSNTLTLGDDLTISGAFTNVSGSLDATGRTIQAAGDWTWTSNAFLSAFSTVVFDGPAQTILSDTQRFYNLTYLGGGTLTLGDDLFVNADFTDSYGNFNANSHKAVLDSATIESTTTYYAGGPGPQLFTSGATVAGTLILDGSQHGSDITLVSGGVLGGRGTVGVVTASGATLSPGDPITSPGVLHTSDVSLDSDSTFTVQVNGTTPGSGYDQLSVNGQVDLDSDYGSGATLSLAVGYTSRPGDSYTLIHSTGGVSGTFAGLPEGAFLPLGFNLYQISYAANGGKDVTLTRLSSTNLSWTGLVSSNWGNAGNWSPRKLPGPGDNVTIPSAGRLPILDATRSVNNLTIAAGASLNLAGHGFTAYGTATNRGTLTLQGTEAVQLAAVNNAAGSTWTYVGSVGDLTLPLLPIPYYNLTIADSRAVPDSFQAAGDLTVQGTLTITGGVFAGADSTVTVGGLSLSGSGIFLAPATLNDSGNWTVATTAAGGFVPDGGTVNLTGNGTQQLSSGGLAFNTLTHIGSGTLNLVGKPLTVTGGTTLSAGYFGGGTLNAGTVPTFFNGGLTLSGGKFTATTGAVTAAGVTINAGTLSAPAMLTDSGIWALNGGAFVANKGTVVFNGTGQTVFGSTTFFNLTKAVTAADTLTFAAKSTQTVGGTLTLKGVAGKLLALRSSLPGAAWNLDPLGTITVSFVDVQDSNNLGKTITPTKGTSLNSGNNSGWVIT